MCCVWLTGDLSGRPWPGYEGTGHWGAGSLAKSLRPKGQDTGAAAHWAPVVLPWDEPWLQEVARSARNMYQKSCESYVDTGFQVGVMIAWAVSGVSTSAHDMIAQPPGWHYDSQAVATFCCSDPIQHVLPTHNIMSYHYSGEFMLYYKYHVAQKLGIICAEWYSTYPWTCCSLPNCTTLM
jgi:hypothetical protein